MSELKYVLERTSLFSSFYRLLAMRDIPEHGVRAGNYGGIVNKKVKLSHQGSCWIDEGAKVLGNVSISDDAYIGDNASVISVDDAKIFIKDSARVFEEARIQMETVLRADASRSSTISGHAKIFGRSFLHNVAEVSGDAKVFGRAKVSSWSWITGTSEISGNAELKPEVSVFGNSKITDNVIIGAGATVQDSSILGSMNVGPRQTIINGHPKEIMEASQPVISPANTDKIIETAFTNENLLKVLEQYPNEVKNSFFNKSKNTMNTKSVKVNDSLLAFNEVLEQIASYETDIVKIIQYPVMTDRTDSYTRTMVSAVNKAKRHLGDPDSDAFKDAVLNLEDAFLAAESNARKLSSTHFSEAEKKQAEKAKDLLSLASNEASSEQEKKNAFKQGFKQLEGLIDVPDVAVDAFRAKIGLKELKA